MKKLGETAEFTFQVAADEVGERRNGGQERNRNRASGTREVKERERQQKRNEFRTQMWKPEPGCSKMNLSWTMPARSGGNFRGKLCEMCVHSLPNVARRSPSTFHPLLFHPIFFLLLLFPYSLPFFATVKEKESRGVETRGGRGARFYLILECAPQLDEFSRTRVSIQYFVISSSREMFGERVSSGGSGELERIDERIFVYGVGTLHLHVASRGICLRGRMRHVKVVPERYRNICCVNLLIRILSIWNFLGDDPNAFIAIIFRGGRRNFILSGHDLLTPDL